MTQSIDAELLAILACPESHAPLLLEGEWLYSTDPGTRRRYPVREGIPIMLIEESEVLSEADWRDVMARHGRLVHAT